jgi:hypothetical protein
MSSFFSSYKNNTFHFLGLIVEGLFCTPAVETEVQQLRQKIKQGSFFRFISFTKRIRMLILNIVWIWGKNLEREGIDLSTISKSPYVFAEILCMCYSMTRLSLFQQFERVQNLISIFTLL